MSKRLKGLAASLLLAAPVILAVSSCDPPKPYAACGNVTWPTPGFAYATSQGAWDIKAHDTDCTTARSIALKEYFSGPAKPFSSGTWNCTAGLPSGSAMGGTYAIWCNGPRGAVVTFIWAT